MTIDEAKRFLELLANKSQSGGFTPQQFNLAADRAQMQLYERNYKIWQDSEEITEAMSVFMQDNMPFAVASSGELAYPSDYVHTIDVRRYYVSTSGQGTFAPCVEVKASDIGEILFSQLRAPTLTYPKYVEYDNHWQFYPKNVGFVHIDYFRRPATPNWAYTITNGRPLYNPNASTQFEFPDFTHNEIVGIMSSYLGINIREGQLLEYAELFKEQNKQG
jgi:hypothetical protein